MRLLIYGINFAPELTGVGKYTGEMAGWLAARGHEIRVVTAPPYYPEWRVKKGYHPRRYSSERWLGMRVSRCPVWVPAHPGGLKRLLHLASFATSSLPVMLRQLVWKPDAIWVVEPSLFCAPTAWLIARLCGARAWLHVQDYEVDAAFQLGLLHGTTMRRAVAAWERYLMRRFDRVSTISERMLEAARAKGVDPARLVSFPNWVDLALVGPTTGGNLLRAELGIAPGDVVALYSGTMGRKQGLKVLAQAASRLLDLPNLLFVFCGDGVGRTELMAQCDGLANVRFLDPQPVERLGALLVMADIHLLPQQADAADLVMPSKLTGILASGRPVVAMCAESAEVARVVQDRGLIAPHGDVKALVEAIRNLAADEELRARLGDNGRAYAQEHLSRDEVLAAFEKGLDEMLSKW